MKISAIIAFQWVFIAQVSSLFMSEAEEKDFIDSLVSNITKRTPHAASNKTVFVLLDLYQLLHVDEKAGLVTAQFWLFYTYYLDNVKWDPQETGVYTIKLPLDTIWVPDLVVQEAAEIVSESEPGQFVDYTGVVISKSAMITIKMTCQFHWLMFPSDIQECKIKLGQWVVDNAQYRIEIDPKFGPTDSMPLRSFKQHGEWNLRSPVKIKKTQRILNSSLRLLSFDQLEYHFVLERQPAFYIAVLVVPSMLFGFLSILTFFLPVECGERVSFATTILLAQVVELLVLSDLLSAGESQDFPILGKYVILMVMFISLSILISVTATYLHFMPQSRPINKHVRLILAKLRRMSGPKVMVEEQDDSASVNEWQQLSAAVDRVAFHLYYMAITLTTLAFSGKYKGLY